MFHSKKRDSSVYEEILGQTKSKRDSCQRGDIMSHNRKRNFSVNEEIKVLKRVREIVQPPKRYIGPTTGRQIV
jgi:hypothetical protein